MDRYSVWNPLWPSKACGVCLRHISCVCVHIYVCSVCFEVCVYTCPCGFMSVSLSGSVCVSIPDLIWTVPYVFSTPALNKTCLCTVYIHRPWLLPARELQWWPLQATSVCVWPIEDFLPDQSTATQPGVWPLSPLPSTPPGHQYGGCLVTFSLSSSIFSRGERWERRV